MSSKVEIINLALGQIPAKGITLETDASASARAAAQFYDATLKQCLRRSLTPWDFATKRFQMADLELLDQTPVNEFSYAYEVPSDCLAIQKFWPLSSAWRKEGNVLYTLILDPIIKYTSDSAVTDPTIMEPDFEEFFYFKLAAAMCPQLAQNPTRQKELNQLAEAAYIHASAAFSMEGTPDKVPDGPWIEAHEGWDGYGRTYNWDWYDPDSIPS